MARSVVLFIVALLLFTFFGVRAAAPAGTQEEGAMALRASLGIEKSNELANLETSVALSARGFSENRGQLLNAEVHYYGTVGDLQVGFADGAVLLVQRHDDQGVLVRVTLVGAERAVPEGRGELTSRSNYFLGKDPTRWSTNVHQYKEVVYANLYPGIDLVCQFGPKGLKYTFLVRPGADPDRIVMTYEGVDGLELGRDGELVVLTEVGELRDDPPEAWMENGDPVPCVYELDGVSALSFRCNSWDASQMTIIDPLIHSTYLGGNLNDGVSTLALDRVGNVYVVGQTDSLNFPTTPGAFRTDEIGMYDVFVAEMNPTLSALVYATYLGGSDGPDWANSIALDAAGNAYIAGSTVASDFPTTPGAFQTAFQGTSGHLDAFVAKLDPAGSALVYSTYLGGSSHDHGNAIALDGAGNAYIGGSTDSADFPATLGAFQTSLRGSAEDAFIAELNPTGSALVFATYIGGSNTDDIHAIALDGGGNVSATGLTYSTNFPATPGAFANVRSGIDDAFVVRLNPAGSALVYATYLGGSDTDEAEDIAVDSAGNAYMIGITHSTDFPTTPGAYQRSLGGAGYGDAFVTKLNSAGSALAFSTYLGGTDDEEGHALTLDAADNVSVVGYTRSTDFPVTSRAFQTVLGGGYDAFVAKLDATGSAVLYATYLGGLSFDGAGVLALDSSGNACLAGTTDSTDFPVTFGAFQGTLQDAGYGDGFVAVLSMTKERDTTLPTIKDVTARPSPQDTGGTVTISANVTDDIAVGIVSVNVTQPDGTHVNRTMTHGAGALYSYATAWTQVGTYPFTIWANDTSDNWAHAGGSFFIREPDTTPPIIVHTPPGSVYIGDTINITANVTDPDSAVADVRLMYASNNGTEQNESMIISGGMYTYTVPAQTSAGTVRYRIYAIDPAGNVNISQEYAVAVMPHPSSTSLDVTLIALIIVVIVVILAIVALFLWRRGKHKESPPVRPQEGSD